MQVNQGLQLSRYDAVNGKCVIEQLQERGFSVMYNVLCIKIKASETAVSYKNLDNKDEQEEFFLFEMGHAKSMLKP